MSLQVKVKKLNQLAKIPKYAKSGDAALDLTATSYTYENGRHTYGTGLSFEIPEGYVGLIYPRSSLGKHDLRLTNCVGVIDSGYRGEVIFNFENHGMNVEFNPNIGTPGILWPKDTKIYKVGDRIGQIMIVPYPKVELVEAEELSETERGSGGFGSSGT